MICGIKLQIRQGRLHFGFIVQPTTERTGDGSRTTAGQLTSGIMSLVHDGSDSAHL